LLLLLLVLGAITVVSGVVVFVAARAAIRGGRQAKQLVMSKAAALGVGDASAAERLRNRLRQEVTRTRRAVDEAVQRGWQVGEMPARVREVATMAERLDGQLAVFAQGQRGAGAPAIPETLAGLSTSVGKLADACAAMRAALLRSDVDLQAKELDEVVNRAQIEAESLRQPSPLDDPRQG
jgi:hypothetical protein